MERSEAAAFRDRFLLEVYPDIGRFMEEDSYEIVGQNLNVPRATVMARFPEDYALLQLRRIAGGRVFSSNGRSYAQEVLDDFYARLADLNQNPDWEDAIADRDSHVLAGLFLQPFVTNLTGRVRGRVNYSTYRNTQFQSLAADGGKIALWELYKRGFRVAFYVHDEFGIYHPDATAEEGCKEVERICIAAMQSLVGDIPVKCEWTVGQCWDKP